MQNDKKIKIIYDTREQDPLRFHEYEVDICRDKLDAGDYTLSGHDRPRDDHSIIIERKKNCQELVSNLVMNWDRFKAELEILSQYKHKAIVVCGPNNFPHIYSRGYTKVSPSFAYSRIADILMDYGIPTIFADTRDEASNLIYRMFIKAIRLNYE